MTSPIATGNDEFSFADCQRNRVPYFEISCLFNEDLNTYLILDYYYSKKELLIQDFFLKPPLQNKGYGRRLYHAIELVARDLGVKRIIAVNSTAQGAGFWQHMGFYEIMAIEDGEECHTGSFEKELFF